VLVRLSIDSSAIQNGREVLKVISYWPHCSSPQVMSKISVGLRNDQSILRSAEAA